MAKIAVTPTSSAHDVVALARKRTRARVVASLIACPAEPLERRR